ncbi:MAG: RsmD family RNA methyltransferase [Chloroflexi bacterium]|nr:RsmD family RNA methyltransferase [Chloroflexota bacterium]
MRVISGSARGRPLRAAVQARPTADLIKGAIFSMLEALAYKRGFEPDEEGSLAAARAWPRVLDLFAGSGGLGIEALSRGAQSAEFVERDRDAARIIQSNLRMVGLEDRARVHQSAVAGMLRTIRAPLDLVFLDPPYADAEALQSAVDALQAHSLLLPSSVVILEQSATAEPPAIIGPLGLTTTRRHGRTRISLYSNEPTP